VPAGFVDAASQTASATDGVKAHRCDRVDARLDH
jgi:hypothetical protein